MKNQAFSHSALARCLYAGDFYDDKLLNDDTYRDQVISNAVDLASNLFRPPLKVTNISVSGKPAYSISDLENKLVIRRCLNNLKKSIPIPTKHRTHISRELSEHFKEGTEYRVYRLDIKSFFESIDVDDVKNRLNSLNNLSMKTRNLIFSFLDLFELQFLVSGLPRGIEISPFLSDLVMLDFDQRVIQHSDVFYYARFVDDIIVITSSRENQKKFLKWLKKHLPTNLQLNHNKQDIKLVENKHTGPQIPDVKVNYLGYEYTIINGYSTGRDRKMIVKGDFRDVRINLTSNKVKSLKTKIAQAFYNHSKSRDFALLRDRLFFLTSNRELLDSRQRKLIPTGIFYSFAMLTHNSESLNELDLFLTRILKHRATRLGQVVGASLSTAEKNELIKFSFRKGFEKRIFKAFHPDRLREITKIW